LQTWASEISAPLRIAESPLKLQIALPIVLDYITGDARAKLK
jgi:hypothetical protein